MNQIEKIVDEMEWALVKVKGDSISTVTDTTGEMGRAHVLPVTLPKVLFTWSWGPQVGKVTLLGEVTRPSI